MNTSNFTTSISVDQSANEVFEAINNVRGWWSEEVVGSTENLNDEFDYHYEDVHRCKMKLIEVIPNKKVVWLVMDNFFSFTKDKSEWTGNKIIFEITEKDNKTHLKFTQEGLVPEYECFDICQNAWNTYIQKSLFSLITTGVGHPNGKDKPQTEDEKNKTTANFTTTFFVNETPKQVFDTVNNVRGWWQGKIEGKTDKLNEEFTYRMQEFHFSKQKVVELIPNEKVSWLVTDSKLNFIKDKSEWTGSTIIFEISEINNKTQLRFTHVGLWPKIECYDSCSNAWTKLIQQSLFSLITTGKGVDIF
jgi:hypothetical protein